MTAISTSGSTPARFLTARTPFMLGVSILYQ
jgi:hypothetical protein